MGMKSEFLGGSMWTAVTRREDRRRIIVPWVGGVPYTRLELDT